MVMVFRDYQIAPAAVDEGEAMQALIFSVLKEYGLRPDCAGVDADVLDIERCYRQCGGEFYAVRQADRLVGTMGVLPVASDACELRKMYLLPEARGVGLGRQLLSLAEAFVRDKGFQWLQLETASVLTEAIALYERNGYLLQCGEPHVGRCDRIYRKAISV